MRNRLSIKLSSILVPVFLTQVWSSCGLPSLQHLRSNDSDQVGIEDKSFVSSAPLLGGNIVGGGGSAIVCRGSNPSIEILDLWEGRLMYNLFPDTGEQSANYIDKIEFALKRLEKVNPLVAIYYREKVANLSRLVSFLPNVVFERIEDEGQIGLKVPDNCKLEQVAVQFKPDFINDTPIKISKDIFDRLDEVNKAYLIMHEIFYEVARQNGASQSKGARRFNQIFFSSAIANMSKIDLSRNLLDFQVHEASVMSLNINMSLSHELHDSGFFRYGTIAPDGGTHTKQKVGLLGGTLAEFYSNGDLKDATLCASLEGTHSGCPKVSAFNYGEFDQFPTLTYSDLSACPTSFGHFDLPTKGGRVSYYESGVLKSIGWNSLSLPIPLKLQHTFVFSFPKICFLTKKSGRMSMAYSFGTQLYPSSTDENQIEFFSTGVPKKIRFINWKFDHPPIHCEFKDREDLAAFGTDKYYMATAKFRETGTIEKVETLRGPRLVQFFKTCKASDGTEISITEDIKTLEFNEDGFVTKF